MAKVLAIGQPVNDAERIAIAHLRDHLPDSFTVLHNFRIDRQGESFEIDIALLAPHALYVIDVKGTRGLIDVHGPKWYPEGRSPFPSPLAKLQSHAKAIKGIVTASHPGRQELDYIHVAAAILLTAPDAHLVDPADIDARGVVKLKDAERYFKDTTQVPAGRNKAISGLHSLISHALHLKAKPTTGRPKYGHWQVLERLGASKTYTESRAQNVFAGGTARVRLYTADPYQPEQQRKAEMHRIANAYKALSALPMHANIVAARDFFEVEDDQAYVLVLDDAAGQALTVHMARPQLALTVDQKWRVAKDLLAALAHAHRHGVIHRNLTPAALIVGPDGMTRVTDFDYARPSADRSATIAGDIVDLVDVAYVAPEAYREPGAATAASDIFSAGLILYELLTGEKPFNGNPQTVFDTNGRFPTPASQIESGLTAAADAWLQSLCEFEADKRPNAEQALAALVEMLAPAPPPSATVTPAPSASAPEPESSFADIDPRSLPQGFQLTRKFLVERKLGQGTFGVVYKVIDTLGDVARVVKLVVSDRHSPLDRLKREYGHLVKVPDHPNVVKVLDADVLPWGQGEQIPYMVFEYVEGSDVAEMIQQRLLAPEDALELGKQVVDGLVHLHSHGFHHCDIKPRNLLWTTKGAKIIDFNVSVRADDREARGGGSRRYLPPDFDPESVPQNGERADRDLYALGLTLYEAVTGRYPWSASEPPPNQPVPDPRELSGFDDLVPELVDVIMRTVAPKRSDRWHSAQDLKQALANVHQARRAVVRATLPLSAVAAAAATGAAALTPAAPNTNPFVAHLLSLYSQSARSNAGTRGMDAWGETVYVATDLDRKLLPAVLAGEFRLVLITGNAGDGKTAFLQHLEREVERQGGTVNRSLPNGSAMQLGQRRYLINYDGSQDEGSKGNDDVLREFMGPFSGVSAATWAPGEVRLIAINEGRLVDFLASYEAEFPALKQLVQTGLATGDASGGVAVVNLNLRSVVAPSDEGSILERTIKRMTDPAHWLACEQCDLKDSCYALHNARSFQDETAGPRLVERLQTLYTMTHLRGKLHITMRDLRSALSFMLISNRDCADIHALYGQSDRNAIVRSFYFNSWLGGGRPTADRLISLLAEVDVGRQEDPRFDRGLDFVQPDDRMLFRFERRANFDFKVLQALFEDLPRGAGVGTIKIRATRHREYVAMTRRKQFFERRDGTWERMLPYRSAKRMVDIVRAHEPLDGLIPQLLNAINRGEGLQRPERLGDNLALQLRHVENGTVRSYRLFPSRQFEILVEDFAAQARFMEHLPTGLRLRFRPEGKQAMASDLVLNLDVFEMLTRLNEGYRPSVEEMQGYYLSLAVFKNSLNAQPYREILLTTTGHDFYRVARRDDGLIEMQLAKHEREMA